MRLRPCLPSLLEVFIFPQAPFLVRLSELSFGSCGLVWEGVGLKPVHLKPRKFRIFFVGAWAGGRGWGFTITGTVGRIPCWILAASTRLTGGRPCGSLVTTRTEPGALPMVTLAVMLGVATRVVLPPFILLLFHVCRMVRSSTIRPFLGVRTLGHYNLAQM